MAFNFLVIAQSAIDWPTVNERYRNTDRMFEVFPIADPENGDAVGISIPSTYFNAQSWNSASRFVTELADTWPIEVYDMYAGQAIDIATYVPDGLEGG